MFTNTMWTLVADEIVSPAVEAAASVAEAAETASSISPVIVMILGFGTVFVGLLFLIGIITLMGRINEAVDVDSAPMSEKIKRGWNAFKYGDAAAAAAPAVADAPAPVAEPAQEEEAVEEAAAEEVSDEEIAVISACVATVMGADVSAIRLASVTRMN